MDRGARDRRRRRGSRACRPACSARDLEEQLNAQRLDDRALPRQLHPLDARRLDRHPLVGHAVRQVRRHRRHRPAGCAWSRPAGMLVIAPGAERRRPARACARWCSAARAGSGSSPRRPCRCTGSRRSATILGYLFPNWDDGARRDARDRRERGVAVGHPRLGRRTRPRSRSRRARSRRPRRQAASRPALKAFLERRKGYDLDEMCLGVHRLRGHRARTSSAQRKLVGEIVSKHSGIVRRRGPGRALRPEEVRHAVHPRLPARPRRARRRVRDVGAVVDAAAALRRR